MNAMEAMAKAEAFAPEPPTLLAAEIPEAAPYPLDALGPLRAAAAAIHDLTQAPPAIGAQSVLGAAALAVQGLVDAKTLHGSAPASLFLLTIAASGERKSSCDKLAMRAVRDFEAERAETYKDEMKAYRFRHDVWKAKREAILRDVKKPDKEAAARADLETLGPEPEPPLHYGVVAGEPTFEGITRNLGSLRPVLGVFSDEGGGFLGGHGMNKENRLKTVSGFSKFWDGATVDRWRAGDGISAFPGRRLSAHLMAQPVVAADLLSDPIATGQGFLARFLLTNPPSLIGTRLRRGHDPASEVALDAFAQRLGDLLRRELPLSEGKRNELSPPVLPLSPEACEVLHAFADEIEEAQAPGGLLANVRPFASKAAEHAARIAAVLTVFADPDAVAIQEGTMRGAVTLAAYYVNEAARLEGAASISADTRDAQRLLAWLQESWTEDFISASDAAQRGPFKEAKRNRVLMLILENHGWLIRVEDGAEVLGSRRREAWRVVREA